jgi:REP element-mobilizing transposase RayT
MRRAISSSRNRTGGASLAGKKQHGGRRRNAGRKKLDPKAPSHAARPSLSFKHPVHVTLRAMRGIPRLRQDCMYKAIRRVLFRYLGKRNFQIVHISIQKNHLHFIVEALDKRALSRNMQSLAINLARAINRAWHRGGGKVWAYRYGAKQIKTRSYARNALSYVLNNWRRHREDFFDGAARRATVDEYSSAVSFDGWTIKLGRPPPDYEPLPVSAPMTALLQHEWLEHGRIDPQERPGPLF